MTKNYYKIEQYKADPSAFGGLIYGSDFNTEYHKGNIASRIVSDWKFDKHCKKQSKKLHRRKKAKKEV